MTTHQIFRTIRRLRFEVVPTLLKRNAWRFTAIFCWLHLGFFAVGHKANIYLIDNRLFDFIVNSLKIAGFVPASQSLLSLLIPFLWLLIITSFSWVQIIGMGLYVAFWPIIMPLYLFRYQSTIRRIRKETYRKRQLAAKSFKRPLFTYTVFSLLVSWFALFSNSSQKMPLFVGMVLVGTLLIFRVYYAFCLTALERGSETGFVDRLIETTTLQIEKIVEEMKKKISSGEVIDFNKYKGNLLVSKAVYRILRIISVWLYGRAAKKRVALYVLMVYAANLAVLGCLSILFWSFVIRFSLSPTAVEMHEVFFASASHVIPGMPDSNSIHVESWIQASISITAWMIFVLYAGPVSSIYPDLKKDYLENTANLYGRMRVARKVLKTFYTAIQNIFNAVREHPELDDVIKVLTTLKAHPDLEKLFSEQPDLANLLDAQPSIREFIEGCGVALPNLQQSLISPPCKEDDLPLALASSPDKDIS